jgi:hypothetical protein
VHVATLILFIMFDALHKFRRAIKTGSDHPLPHDIYEYEYDLVLVGFDYWQTMGHYRIFNYIPYII